ncbi:MAG: TatD family hydrolase [Kiloniellales bacterium]|nr:TatD family hydrolase [Kiloniellales bacterium]
MLIDSHCHLDYLARDGDLEEIVGRARRAGVSAMVTICTKLSEFDTVRSIAQRYPEVSCSVGVHPHEAEQEGQESPDRLRELAKLPEVVGIGETGLDYFYEHSPREAQQRSFRSHIAAARETGLPLIVHTRDADADTVAILREEVEAGAVTGVIHCFSAGPELAEAALELGFYIGVSGIMTFKKAEELRETLRRVPLERLLVETDAPYLAPVPQRGKQNEPAFVVHTAAALAELKAVEADELAAVTSENFYTLFSRAPRAISA